ncbi:MAG: hypothetical protein IIT38_05815, partial [Bacteroidales bacterium]|nr:hypothetical protein [Bacteroidales bacterium]
QVVAKVFIDNLGGYSVALGREKPVAINAEDLELYLSSVQQQDSTMYSTLYQMNVALQLSQRKTTSWYFLVQCLCTATQLQTSSRMKFRQAHK